MVTTLSGARMFDVRLVWIAFGARQFGFARLMHATVPNSAAGS